MRGCGVSVADLSFECEGDEVLLRRPCSSASLCLVYLITAHGACEGSQAPLNLLELLAMQRPVQRIFIVQIEGSVKFRLLLAPCPERLLRLDHAELLVRGLIAHPESEVLYSQVGVSVGATVQRGYGTAREPVRAGLRMW